MKRCPLCKTPIEAFPQTAGTVNRCPNPECKMFAVVLVDTDLENPIFDLYDDLIEIMKDVNNGTDYEKSIALNRLYSLVDII